MQDLTLVRHPDAGSDTGTPPATAARTTLSSNSIFLTKISDEMAQCTFRPPGMSCDVGGVLLRRGWRTGTPPDHFCKTGSFLKIKKFLYLQDGPKTVGDRILGFACFFSEGSSDGNSKCSQKTVGD